MPKFWKPIWREFRRWLKEPRIIFRSEMPLLTTTIEVQSWLPCLVFLAVLVWFIASPSPIAIMTAVSLGGILLSSFLWARSMLFHVRGRRRLRFAAMQVGDELEEQISLRNNSYLPVIWAEFMDRSNIPGYTVSSARAASQLSQVEWRAHTVCTRRGIFNLGPWELRLGEPLGIFIVRQVYLQHQEILVYPPLAVLPEHILPHRGAQGDHRPLNQPLRAETILSTTVRAYSPGDPLRHIHWRTTARHLDPYVKVFAPEAASRVWLVPDFDAAVHLSQESHSSEETMVTVIASLAAELLQQNLSVGMFASADTESIVLPRLGQTHLWSILQALAPLRAVSGRPLADVLVRAQSLVSGNDLLIVATPSTCPDWIVPLRRISHSRGSTGRAEAILLDPQSYGGEIQADGLIPILLEQGIAANLLRREDVQLIGGYYGEVSRWEFSVLGTGRVIARNKPRSASTLPGSALDLYWNLPGK
jgi:uncharacterized protein (DUF58 family)